MMLCPVRNKNRIRDGLLLLFCGYVFFFLLVIYQTIPKAQTVEIDIQPQRVAKNALQTKSKDVFNIVTAASSEDFKSLLKLIYSLTKSDVSISLWLWSLDLASCEISYIEGLETPNMKINIEQFPFHFYPLHVRLYHLLAIKPIVLEIASMAFGQALWMEPNSILTGNIKPLIAKLSQTGFIADSGNTNAIGMSYFKFQTFISQWVTCVKNASCLKSHTSKVIKSEEDKILSHFKHQHKLGFTSFRDALEKESTQPYYSTFLDAWQNSKSKDCPKEKVCILTGSHQWHKCLTPQLGKLRRNKVRYAERHGYRYIEETYGFHKSGPCGPVWDKIHGILKHLPDCNVLMWVDSDCIFTNINKSIESHFEEHPGKDVLVNWPKTDPTLNAGVMLMKNTKAARDFLLNIMTGDTWTNDWCRRYAFEQAAIVDQLKAGNSNERFAYEKNNYFLQGLCGLRNGKCLWKENDYIAHFAPPACPEINDFIKDFFDKYPQFLN